MRIPRVTKVGGPNSRAACVLAVGVLFVSVLGGCGSDEPEGGAGSGADELDVALQGAIAVFAYPYLAETKGFFDKQGLEVNLLENTGANTGNFMVSGDADVAISAIGIPLNIAQEGKEATMITGYGNQYSSVNLVGAKDVTTIDQLRGERLGTLYPGAVAFGAATRYNRELELDAEIVTFADNASLSAAVASGQVDGAVGAAGLLDPLVDGGQVNSLIDANDEEDRREYIGEPYLSGAMWGMAENLEENRSAVVKFVKAIDEAEKYFNETSSTQLAEDLRQFDAFKTTPAPALAELIDASRLPLEYPFLVDESAWEQAVSSFTDWGIEGFDPENEAFSYANFVDPSYVDEAGISGVDD